MGRSKLARHPRSRVLLSSTQRRSLRRRPLKPHEVDMKARDFWSWFSGVVPQLQQQLDDDSVDDGLLGELDQAILSLGDFGWEVGPDEDGSGYIFVLSPGSDLELLKEAEAVIAEAPRFARWRLFSCRPKKTGWTLKFLVYDEAGREFEFDGSTCEFKIVIEGGKSRVLLRGPGFRLLPGSRHHDAAGILLDGILGESARMKLVSSYEVVSGAGGTEWHPIAELDRQFTI